MTTALIDLFSPEYLGTPNEPAWLADRRAQALAAATDAGLPTTEPEEWRYSRVDRLDVAPFRPGGPGWASSAGVTVTPLAEHPEGPDLLNAITAYSADTFVHLNTAFSADAIVIDIAPNTVLDTPIDLRQAAAAGQARFPRVIVRLGANAHAVVIERSAGSDSAGALVVPVTELLVGPAARLTHVSLQAADASAVTVARIAARVEQQGNVELFHIALGSSWSRARFDCQLVGRGANGSISTLYLADGEQSIDLRTFQDHLAPDTTSTLQFKGALKGSSHAVYTGLIRIDETARGSVADQSNTIIKLSPDAWAESVPNLEINHNDVRCSHASAVGPIDPDQRFYLESRGVPPEAAERLVVNGFFAELLATCPDAEVAAAASALIAEVLR